MRFTHPAAWAGLLLNFALISMLLYVLALVDPSSFRENEEAFAYLIANLRTVRVTYFILLTAQASAIALISINNRLGLPLAVFSSLPMLPFSLLYVLGCFLSQQNVKYAGLTMVPAVYHDAVKNFSSAAVSRIRLATGVTAAACLFFFLAGSVNLTVTAFGLALVCLYLDWRARTHHALSLHERHITLVPGIFSPRLLIRYSDMREAALFEDQSIHFQVDTPEGAARTVVWSLKNVEEPYRRAALEELGDVLAGHGIPLR